MELNNKTKNEAFLRYTFLDSNMYQQHSVNTEAFSGPPRRPKVSDRLRIVQLLQSMIKKKKKKKGKAHTEKPFHDPTPGQK